MGCYAYCDDGIIYGVWHGKIRQKKKKKSESDNEHNLSTYSNYFIYIAHGIEPVKTD